MSVHGIDVVIFRAGIDQPAIDEWGGAERLPGAEPPILAPGPYINGKEMPIVRADVTGIVSQARRGSDAPLRLEEPVDGYAAWCRSRRCCLSSEPKMTTSPAAAGDEQMPPSLANFQRRLPFCRSSA